MMIEPGDAEWERMCRVLDQASEALKSILERELARCPSPPLHYSVLCAMEGPLMQMYEIAFDNGREIGRNDHDYGV